MGRNEATRPKRQLQARQSGSRTTSSIIANREMFRITVWTLAFTFALLAVPTAMALVRGWM